jgi:hypothetical protein
VVVGGSGERVLASVVVVSDRRDQDSTVGTGEPRKLFPQTDQCRECGEPFSGRGLLKRCAEWHLGGKNHAEAAKLAQLAYDPRKVWKFY